MKTNYLLIDYENVQPKKLPTLAGQPFKVIIFVGASQTKIPVEFASALQALGDSAEYVRISGNGSNALDFHIAFTIGELSKSDPDATFHIISKDTGFDPLLDYVRKKGISAHRSKELADVVAQKVAPSAKTEDDKVDAIVRNLSSRAGRPRKVRTLSNTITALFPRSLKEGEVAGLVKALEKRGYIAIDGENVSYHLANPS